MALVIADRVRETSTTTGTGNFTLGGAVSGFESFLSAVGEGNTCYYTISGGTEWEVGLGTITSGELVRTTVYKSSNADAAVNFSAGTKDVFVTYPGDKAVFKDASGNVNALGTITSGVWNGTEITVPYGGTGAASFTAGALLKGNGQSAIAEAVAGTDYVTPSGTETLTNKTIAFSSNTLTDVASTNTSQTLTNKTLTSPQLNTPTATGHRETRVAIPASDIDLSAGNYFTKTISGATTFTVSNVAASGSVSAFVLELTDGGSAAVTFFSGVDWPAATPPTLTASGVDVLAFFTTDGGVNWRGFVLGLGMA